MNAVAPHITTFQSMDDASRKAILSQLSDEEAYELLYKWEFWARADQKIPPGDLWTIWLIVAGRGWGKTRTGVETVREWVETGQCGRLALIAEDAGDARDVMVEGESGIMACSRPDFRPHYEPSKKRLTWPNGALATIYSADDPESLRGPQFDGGWIDELAKFKYAQQAWDMYQFGLRLGRRPRTVITTTPKPIPLIKDWAREWAEGSSNVYITRGSTFDNIRNLSPVFAEAILKRYQGTRLGRQEIEAEILSDTPGALWTAESIEKARFDSEMPEFERIVVAIDPSGSDGETGDSQGIIVAGAYVGKDKMRRAMVLHDGSVKLSPNGWAAKTIAYYRHYNADAIIAEKNYGGEMVKSTIHNADDTVPVSMVNATRGKHVRCEPVSMLYEQGRIKHFQEFRELEDQMVLMTSTEYTGRGSPDRLDALVWAITELMNIRSEPVGLMKTRRKR